MSQRSDFILGDYVFIKVIKLNEDQGIRLVKALYDDKNPSPFTSHEFLFNYLASKDKSLLFDSNINKKYNTLITPGTKVYVSGKSYDVDDFQKYQNSSYSDTIAAVETYFSPMDSYLENIATITKRNEYIQTALIISERMTGNYDDFLSLYLSDNNNNNNTNKKNKLFADSMIHISYLYHQLQHKYQAVHGDPKTQNYTWLELETPIDIVYNFRDEYDRSDNRIIKRTNVKHLFYLTDTEFIFSPITQTVSVNSNNGTNRYYLDFFTTEAAWYGEEWSNPNDRVFVPKITTEEKYKYNDTLYGGYFDQPDQPNIYYDRKNQDQTNHNPENTNHLITLYDFYPIFPRMFTIDLLTLIKMLLTYWYADKLNGSNLRKLHMYFTHFKALSYMEENPNRRGEGDYLKLSAGTFAVLLNS